MSHNYRQDETILFGGTDGVEFLGDTLEFGGCDPHIELTVAASCPGGGPIQVDWAGAAPGASAVLLYAESTWPAFTIPEGNPCEGTRLGLGSQAIQVVWNGETGEFGSRTLHATSGSRACNAYLQLLVLDECALSNVARIE
jgi:hypothetical protein